MRSLHRILICSMAATAACTPVYEAWRGGDPKSPTPYRYVLAVDESTGETVTGGAHTIIVPSVDRDVREAIDVPNSPTRLHPILKGEHAIFDATLTDGESDWDIFASSWWAQSNNGIAKRWTGGPLDYNDHSQPDQMSPTEKYDLLFHPGDSKTVKSVEHHNYPELRKPQDERGEKHSHDAVTVVGPATAWELENHGIYQNQAHPDHWWGHCNGWASYVTAEPNGKPARDIRVQIEEDRVVECDMGNESCLLVRMGDIEALMSELYFSDTSTFAGRRCNEDPEKMERDEYGRPVDPACRDLNAGTFHIAAVGLLNRGAEHLGTKQDGFPPFIVDHSYDWEVWNFPVKKFQMHQSEDITAEEAMGLVGGEGEYTFNRASEKFVRVNASYWMVSDGVPDGTMRMHADDRNIPLKKVELHYILELSADSTILGGEWIAQPEVEWGPDSKKLHPDFLWSAVSSQGWGEQGDDLGGNHDNPHIAYSHVKALLDCANDASTCAPAPEPEPEPEPVAYCADSCDSLLAKTGPDGNSCYCDSACVSYNDCCPDRADTCGAVGTSPAPQATCEGFCDKIQPVPGTECFCDDSCEQYGDCCADKAAVCD